MIRNYQTITVILMMMFVSLSGCFGETEEEAAPVIQGFFDFDQELDNRTWYHYPGGEEAHNNTSFLGGNNVPYYSSSSYYSIGMSTFEPTMGITSTGNLYISSWGNGPSGSTAIVQCSGLVELQSLDDYSCQNVYDPITPIPNSNDPYVYVDPWTDRIMKFDMHALLGMTVEWSDDEGASWSLPTPATGYSVQDHQTIASAPYPAIAHETLWVLSLIHI